jgi:hypothetical protein
VSSPATVGAVRGSVLGSGVVIAVAALLLSAPAAADDGALRWSGPPGCDGAALVRERVAARLGRPLDERDAIDAAVEVTAIDGGLRVHLALRTASATGERELFAATCADAAEAVALVVALAIADAPPPAAAAPPAALPARPPPVPVITRSPPVAARRAWSGGVRAQATTLLGPLPEAAVGVEITAWLAWRRAALEVSGAAWPARRATATGETDGETAGVDVGLRTAGARLCWRWLGAAIQTCAIGQLGELEAEGVGVTDARAGSGRWSALGAGGSAHLRLNRRVLLVASVEAGRALDRPRFRLADGTVLFRPSAWTAQLAAGIAVAW